MIAVLATLTLLAAAKAPWRSSASEASAVPREAASQPVRDAAAAKPVAETAVRKAPDLATVGELAPPFTATDADGKARTLADFTGKIVVLEWNNPECPFVKKHYGSGNMQKLQKELTAKEGVVWLSVLSSAPGKQGHMDGATAKKMIADKAAAPSAYLLDPDGKVGRLYGAKTTPHMYVIDAAGTLVYAGGIDDKATASAADIPGARNHVRAAVEELLAGKPVSVPSSQPYGCSVKY